MSMRKRSFFAVMLSGVVALIACQPGPATPTPTLFPVVPGEMNLVAGCSPRDVDNWTEAVGYLVEAFGDLITHATEASGDELTSILEEMRVYKASIDELAVPADCARETHQLIAMTVAEVISSFDARLTDPKADVRPAVTRAQATMQLVQSRIAELAANMDATYEAQGR